LRNDLPHLKRMYVGDNAQHRVAVRGELHLN
jgi:hypothetical protein